MVLSLSRKKLFEYVIRQINTYFPDECLLGGDKRAFDLALERLDHCFKRVVLKNYQKNGESNFYHLNMDQYSAFLYLYANSVWRLGGNKILADKLVLLNRALSGMWCSYKNNLPDIFVFGHAVGTVLGNGNYSDYLVVMQNVTVNTVDTYQEDSQPHIGKGCYLSAGAKIIGKVEIGDWCTLGVNTVLHNQPLKDSCLAYTDSNGTLNIREHNNYHLLKCFFDI